MSEIGVVVLPQLRTPEDTTAILGVVEPNVMLPVREVPCSNLGPETDYPDRGFS
jgi:hypothetical protein